MCPVPDAQTASIHCRARGCLMGSAVATEYSATLVSRKKLSPARMQFFAVDLLDRALEERLDFLPAFECLPVRVSAPHFLFQNLGHQFRNGNALLSGFVAGPAEHFFVRGDGNVL